MTKTSLFVRATGGTLLPEVSMHVHPEKGNSQAAILLHQWDTEYDAELTADLLQLAERLGWNWWDVMIDCCVKQCDLAWQHTNLSQRRP